MGIYYSATYFVPESSRRVTRIDMVELQPKASVIRKRGMLGHCIEDVSQLISAFLKS
jgi:hypothetical protein